MKRYTNYSVVIFLLSISIVMIYSCKVKNAEPNGAYVGYDYYPLEVGRYNVYDVYDTIYNGIVRKDSVYQLKELIQSYITEGQEVKFVLHQYFKKTTDTDWPGQPDSVWSLTNTSNQLIREENNIQYIKLVFPVKEGKTWNGNARNIYDAQTYTMKNVDGSYALPSLVFNPTLMMEISNTKSVINKDHRYEIYARGIGPIKREYTVYAYDQSQLGSGVIEYGYHKVFILKSYGKN